jgi:hypothetical protein
MEEVGRNRTPNACRRGVAGTVVLGVAAIHVFRIGAHLRGTPYRLYSSYASDLLLPLAMYFVLCLSERNLSFLGDWRARAAAVLLDRVAQPVLCGSRLARAGAAR